MFNIGVGEMLVLVVLALLVFGERLPKAAGQAGRALRQLRAMANAAQRDLKAGLGPEFADFDVTDLNPRNFVRKHLLEDIETDFNGDGLADNADPTASSNLLDFGERPPFDPEAT